MGIKEKLRERFLKMPSFFTFDEMQRLLERYAMKQVLENLKEAELAY